MAINPTGFASHLDRDLLKNAIELGGSLQTGNNPATTVLGKFTSDLDINYLDNPWGYSYLLSGRRATARGIETARMARTHAEGRYLFSPRTYLFTKINYVYNAYDVYDIVVRDSTGLGQILIKDERQKLTVEAGPGSTHQRIAGPDTWQNQFIGHAESNYLLHLSENAEFTQDVSVDVGSINTFVRAISGIKTSILSNVDLRLSFEIDYYSTIPPQSTNTKKTDTYTDIALVYKF